MYDLAGKLTMKAWTGLIWLRIGTGGGEFLDYLLIG
jgi:hypothetical protein